jgi:hypothetical protein
MERYSWGRYFLQHEEKELKSIQDIFVILEIFINCDTKAEYFYLRWTYHYQ